MTENSTENRKTRIREIGFEVLEIAKANYSESAAEVLEIEYKIGRIKKGKYRK